MTALTAVTMPRNTTVARRSTLATSAPTSASRKMIHSAMTPVSSNWTTSWAVVSACASNTGICPKSAGSVMPSALASSGAAWSTWSGVTFGNVIAPPKSSGVRWLISAITLLIRGTRFKVTWPSTVVTAADSPRSTLTTDSCTSRLISIHTCSNSGDASTSTVACSMPPRAASSAGTARNLPAGPSRSSISVGKSTIVRTSSATSWAMIRWRSGSWGSGATASTQWSVSSSVLFTHVAVTASTRLSAAVTASATVSGRRQRALRGPSATWSWVAGGSTGSARVSLLIVMSFHVFSATGCVSVRCGTGSLSVIVSSPALDVRRVVRRCRRSAAPDRTQPEIARMGINQIG